MKRLLGVLTLICCLSFPVLGGHRPVGDYACSCGEAGCLEDYPGECGEYYRATQQSASPNDTTAGFGIVLVALLLWLRLKS